MGFINPTTERLRARKMAERKAIERADRERRAREKAARLAAEADAPDEAPDQAIHHPQTRCASGTSAPPSKDEGASSAAGNVDVEHSDRSEAAHPAATSLAEGSASLAPLPQAGGAGAGPCVGAAFARLRETPASTGIADGADGAIAEAGQPCRHTIFTPRAQAAFLDQLAHSGHVRLACKAAGVSPQTAYRARRRQRGLALAWDAALLAARGVAEEALASRALDGVEVPVFYHGEEVAVRRHYSDRLLLAHLARLDKIAERAEAQAALARLDDRIESLREGEELPEPEPEPEPAAEAADRAGGISANNPVPSVPSCRTSPSSSVAVGLARTPSSSVAVGQTENAVCENCGGACNGPEEALTEADCQWLGHRLDRM